MGVGTVTRRPPRAPGAPPGGTPKPSNGKEGDEPPAPEKVEIDIDGIANRVVAFPQTPGRYGRVAGGKGRVFIISFPVTGAHEDHDKPAGRLEA